MKFLLVIGVLNFVLAQGAMATPAVPRVFLTCSSTSIVGPIKSLVVTENNQNGLSNTLTTVKFKSATRRSDITWPSSQGNACAPRGECVVYFDDNQVYPMRLTLIKSFGNDVPGIIQFGKPGAKFGSGLRCSWGQ